MFCKFNKNDYLMDSVTKELYFVVRIKDSKIMLRKESDDSVEELAYYFVNRTMTKITLETYELLYKEKEGKTNEINKNSV